MTTGRDFGKVDVQTGLDIREQEFVHPQLREVFDSFDRGDVAWALLWMPDGGLGAPRGDVDILMREADLREAEILLVAAGFSRVPRRGASFHFLAYCAGSDQWLWLHIVSAVGLGPAFRVAIGERQVEAFRRPDNPAVPMLPDPVAFWVLLWHCVTKGTIAQHHRAALSHLSGAASKRAEMAAAVAGACGGVSTDDLVSAIAGGDWQVAGSLVAAVHQRAKRRRGGISRVVRAPGRLLRSWARRRGPRAISVAVLGPDGAGKTSLIEGIRTTVPLPTRVIYMGLTGGGLRHAARLRLPGLVFAASALVVWSRYARGRYHASRGRLVLFDRYVYDAVAPHARKNRPWHRASRRVLSRLCPAPDMVLLLDAPGRVMYDRKRAYTAEVLEDWRQRFLTLRDQVARLHVIDATQPPGTVRAQAVQLIWQRLAEGWRADAASTGGDT